MASVRSNRFAYDLLKGTHGDLTAITIKVALLNAAYVPNKDHDFMNDVVANELSGAGYSRQTLGSKTVTQDDTNDVAYFDAADVTFTGINAGTIGSIVLFRDRGGADSANEILVILDNTDRATDGANETIIWPADGIFAL